MFLKCGFDLVNKTVWNLYSNLLKLTHKEFKIVAVNELKVVLSVETVHYTLLN